MIRHSCDFCEDMFAADETPIVVVVPIDTHALDPMEAGMRMATRRNPFADQYEFCTPSCASSALFLIAAMREPHVA